jgi:aconitate hydratase
MGVLPLQFLPGESVYALGLSGREVFSIEGLGEDLEPKTELTIQARRENGSLLTFKVLARLDTPIEVNYYRNGGILHTVLRSLI